MSKTCLNPIEGIEVGPKFKNLVRLQYRNYADRDEKSLSFTLVHNTGDDYTAKDYYSKIPHPFDDVKLVGPDGEVPLTDFSISQPYDNRSCWLDKADRINEYDVQCDSGWSRNPARIMLKFNNQEVSTPAGSYTLTVRLTGEETKPLVTTFFYPGDLVLQTVPAVYSFWDSSMGCGELLVELGDDRLDGDLDVKTKRLNLLIDPYFSVTNDRTPGLFVKMTREQYQDIYVSGFRIRINGALVSDIAEHYFPLLNNENPTGLYVEFQTLAYSRGYNYSSGYSNDFNEAWAACTLP
jgi:hypothetical protein